MMEKHKETLLPSFLSCFSLSQLTYLSDPAQAHLLRNIANSVEEHHNLFQIQQTDILIKAHPQLMFPKMTPGHVMCTAEVNKEKETVVYK